MHTLYSLIREIRRFLFPGPDAFDRWRAARMWLRTLLAAVVIAAIFGVALYLLSKGHPS